MMTLWKIHDHISNVVRVTLFTDKHLNTGSTENSTSFVQCRCMANKETVHCVCALFFSIFWNVMSVQWNAWINTIKFKEMFLHIILNLVHKLY